MNREKIIVKTSVIGIITNLLLTIFKMLVGLLSNSIAITLDAVNNLSDAISSGVTIVGTKLALKQPDKKHPYGHGRIEYLSATIISIIVLYAGGTALYESIKKIIFPENPDYSLISIFVVCCAIIVKLFLGIYVKKIGKKVNSESLIGSGKDALIDSIISFSTFIAALVYILFKISLEAWLGILISFLIIKTGYDMIKETLSHILGERVDRDIALSVKKTVCSFDEVYGAYDLFLNNYGPDTHIGSIYIEVDENLSALKIDKLTREIKKKVITDNHVLLTSVGIYSTNINDKEAMKIKNEINNLLSDYKEVLQMHAFYLNKDEKSISFDLIIDFENEDRNSIYNMISDEISKKYPGYILNITMDIDASD